jgi:hypothetical protein
VTLRAVDSPVALDEWEPLPDGRDSAQQLRDALEDGLKRGDRVLVFWIGENADKTITQAQCNAQRRSRKLHWMMLFGAMHEWLQRWAHNDFEH